MWFLINICYYSKFNFVKYNPNIYTKVSFYHASPFFDIYTFDGASWDSFFFIDDPFDISLNHSRLDSARWDNMFHNSAPLHISLNHSIREVVSWGGTFEFKAEIDFTELFETGQSEFGQSLYIWTKLEVSLIFQDETVWVGTVYFIFALHSILYRTARKLTLWVEINYEKNITIEHRKATILCPNSCTLLDKRLWE